MIFFWFKGKQEKNNTVLTSNMQKIQKYKFVNPVQ